MLATDEATSRDVALHALGALGETYDLLVLLQTTSPLRIAADIDGCIEVCHRREAHSAATVVEVDKPPHWMFTFDPQSSRLVPVIEALERPTRRQDVPSYYALNGAVFVVTPQQLQLGGDFVDSGTVGYVMPPERSIDIDKPIDLVVAQAVLEAKKHGTV
jgi:CMP-N-acetylneuraminic acid synthetase